MNKKLTLIALAVVACSTQMYADYALVEAVSKKNMTEVDRLFKEHKVTRHEKNEAFVKACELGLKRFAKKLLDNKANINARNKEKYTGLMLAAKNGNKEIVRFLMDNGANRTLKGGPKNKTAAGIAAENHRPDIALLLNPVFNQNPHKKMTSHIQRAEEDEDLL